MKGAGSAVRTRRLTISMPVVLVHANPDRDAVQRAYHHRNKERLNAARVERQRGEDGTRQTCYTIPVSKGGPGIMDNVSTSHLGCNIRKGAALTGRD